MSETHPSPAYLPPDAEPPDDVHADATAADAKMRPIRVRASSPTGPHLVTGTLQV